MFFVHVLFLILVKNTLLFCLVFVEHFGEEVELILQFYKFSAALLVALDFRANGTELGYVDDQAIQDQANHQDKRVWCNFCKKNGERYIVYSSHSLKNKFGFVMCPVLQRYTCPICNATGYHAHTLKYCPKLK